MRVFEWINRKVVFGLLVGVVVLVVLVVSFAEWMVSNIKEFEYAVGLWGDLFYLVAQVDIGVFNLIVDMNS